jgi:hypothetical protein
MVPIEVARAIRSDRLGKIRTGGLAFPLVEGAKVVLHSIPVRRDQYAINIDVGAADCQATNKTSMIFARQKKSWVGSGSGSLPSEWIQSKRVTPRSI